MVQVSVDNMPDGLETVSISESALKHFTRLASVSNYGDALVP